MIFLAPLFLLGALGVALPIVFHLVRRTTREHTVFSSLMFLRPAPPRLTRRNRLEHILLLLLRCAVIGLLAAGFARPLIRHALPAGAGAGAPRRMVMLLDSSASMQRGRLWAEARAQAESMVRRASPADQVALFTFDRQLNPLISLEEWKAIPAGDRAALAHQRLATATPSWAGTDLDQALIRAAETLAEFEKNQAPGPRQVVLISDLQAGSRLTALQGYEWPKGVELVVERVARGQASNAGLHWIADQGETARATEPTVRLRVSNEPDSHREQFQVGWARPSGGLVSNAVPIYVPAGQHRVVELAVPPAESGADRIVLQGDDDPFDNTVFVAPTAPARATVLYLGAEAETDTRQPLYFLRRAFQETRRQSVRVMARPTTATLAAAELEAPTLYVATDGLPGPQADAIRGQVARGKTLLFVPRSGAAGPSLARLLGLGEVRLSEATASGSPLRSRPEGEGAGGATAERGYGMLTEIDFRHPLFAPFADVRFSDFTKIHFWKHRRVEVADIPKARVLAQFDDGDPAIVEVPVGRGRLLLLASGWNPADSQLALSSKFVPLLYSVLELSGATPPAPSQHIVGDIVPLPTEWNQTNASVAVRRPDGSTLTLAAGTTNFTQTLMPGIYRASAGPATLSFAVNLEAAESRTAPLPVEDLERLGAPVQRPVLAGSPSAKRKIELQNAELESRQKLWRWFLVATLVVLLTETWLAGRTARRLAAPGEASV